jgi:hypothetical protein
MARKKIQGADGIEQEVDVPDTVVTPGVISRATPAPVVVVKITSEEPAKEPEISERTRLEMEAGRAALAAYASRV